uniref:EF-hand domain-containing protein n=1 Tax=Rhabditophanes sp. KR3021 TaxID=114890 RepID=A0AC35TMJ3_9BILA
MRFGISNDELSFSINKPSTRFVLSEQRLNKEKEAALSKSRAYLQKFDENLKLNKKKLKEELDLSIARIEAEQLAKIKNLTITTTSPRQVLENKDPIFTQYIDAILPTNWLFDNLDKSLEFEPERYGLEWDDELNKYSEIKEKLVPKTVLGKIDDNSQNMPYDICKGLPSQFSTFSKDICSGLLPQNNALSKNILAQPIKQNDQKMVADIEFPKSTFIDVMENEYNASSKAGLVLNGKEVLASERAFKTWIRQFFNSDRALDKEDFKAVIRHVNEFKTCFLPIEGSELYEHVKLLHSSRGGLDASLFDIFTIMMSTLRLDTSIYVWMCEILYISIKDNIMPDFVDAFIESLDHCFGDVRKVISCFQLFNDEEINLGKAISKQHRATKQKKKFTDAHSKKVFVAFYKLTHEIGEYNEVWGTFCNILKYNSKFLRTHYINLMTEDCKNGILIPWKILDLAFQEAELVKVMNDERLIFQYALQSHNINTDNFKLLKKDGERSIFNRVKNACFEKYIDMVRINPEDSETIALAKQETALGKLLSDLSTKENLIRMIDVPCKSTVFSNMCRICRVFDNRILEINDSDKVIDDSYPVKAADLRDYSKLITKFGEDALKEVLLIDNLYELHTIQTVNTETMADLLQKLKFRKGIQLANFVRTWPEENEKKRIFWKLHELYYKTDYPDRANCSLSRSRMYNSDYAMLTYQNIEGVKILEKFSKEKIKYISNVDDMKAFISSIEEFVEQQLNNNILIDVKFAQTEGREKLELISLKYGDNLAIVFVQQIADIPLISNFLSFLFGNGKIYLIGFEMQKIRSSLSTLYSNVKILERPVSRLVCLLLNLKALTHTPELQSQIPIYYKKTWKKVFYWNSQIGQTYTLEQEEEFFPQADPADGPTDNCFIKPDFELTKREKNCIRLKSLILTFAELVFLTTGLMYDDSEDSEFSFWQRFPLRYAQEESLKVRMVGLMLAFENMCETYKLTHEDSFGMLKTINGGY